MESRFETFTTQIAKLSRYIRKLKTSKTFEFNLKGPCVSCIYNLYKFSEGLTSSQLCEICDEDKGAISRTLEFLEKNNFISCNSNAKKRYNSPLFLTEKGKEVGRKIVEIIDSVLEEVSVGISEEEREIFYKTLIKISNNLQKICED